MEARPKYETLLTCCCYLGNFPIALYLMNNWKGFVIICGLTLHFQPDLSFYFLFLLHKKLKSSKTKSHFWIFSKDLWSLVKLVILSSIRLSWWLERWWSGRWLTGDCSHVPLTCGYKCVCERERERTGSPVVNTSDHLSVISYNNNWHNACWCVINNTSQCSLCHNNLSSVRIQLSIVNI